MSFYADYDFFNDVVHRYGFDNFVYLWNDTVFHKALKNTFVFVVRCCTHFHYFVTMDCLNVELDYRAQ